MSEPITLSEPIRILGSKNCYPARPRGARRGIMLHFDDSSSDASGEEWFHDPTCHVSYNRLYPRAGGVVQITASMEEAAWHAGVCITPNANRVFYGLAIEANDSTVATATQIEAIAHDCAALFALNLWAPSEVTARIVGHEDEACFANGKLGRKVDPTGTKPTRPILSKLAVRHRVLELLGAV
jgi:N-acetyl-anhydromuramyl-L-alanine amidase AmpD